MQFNLRTHIACPPAELFAFLQDIDRYAGRPGTIVPVYDKLTKGPSRLGTRYREVIRVLPGWHIKNQAEIIRLEPDARLDLLYAFRRGNMHGVLSYRLTPTSQGTLLVQQQSLHLRGWLRLFTLPVFLLFGRQVRRRLADIQFLLETGALERLAQGDGGVDFYVARRQRILRGTKGPAEHLRPLLAARYGSETAVYILSEAQQRLAALIPHIPYIGGRRSSVTRVLIGTAYSLAFYQAMHSRGEETAVIGALHQQAVEAHFASIPQWQKRIARLGWGFFFRRPGRWLLQRLLRRQAAQSQKRRYAADFVFDYVPGNGRTFDLGIDYTECAVCKFFAAQGAAEFTRYVCLYDYPHSALTRTGLVRTTTLAEGAERCDFRFKYGRSPQNRQVTQVKII